MKRSLVVSSSLFLFVVLWLTSCMTLGMPLMFSVPELCPWKMRGDEAQFASL